MSLFKMHIENPCSDKIPGTFETETIPLLNRAHHVNTARASPKFG